MKTSFEFEYEYYGVPLSVTAFYDDKYNEVSVTNVEDCGGNKVNATDMPAITSYAPQITEYGQPVMIGSIQFTVPVFGTLYELLTNEATDEWREHHVSINA